MRHATIVGLVFALLPASASGSAEQILSPQTIAITVDAGKPFGRIAVTIKKKAGSPAVAAITIKVDKKTFRLPKKAFADLSKVRLSSVEVRRERGYGKHPWLYVTFLGQTRDRRLKTSKQPPRVYFAIQNGKLMHRSISFVTPKGRYDHIKKSL